MENSELYELIENRRSLVRVGASWAAIIFIFGFSPIAAAWIYFKCDMDKGMELFHVIFPVATGIISYWFASRTASNTDKDKD